jgi:hypothetical protein
MSSAQLIATFNTLAAAIKADRAAIRAIMAPVLRRRGLSVASADLLTSPGVVLSKPETRRIYDIVQRLEPPAQLAKIQALQKDVAVKGAEAQRIYQELNPGNLLPLEILLAIASVGIGDAFYGAAVAASTATASTAATSGAVATAAAAVPSASLVSLAPVVIAAPVAGISTIAAPALAAVGTGAAAAAASTAESSASSEIAGVAVSASTAETLAATVGSEITKLTGSSTVGSLASDFISGAGSLIADVEKFIGPLLTYAKDVLDEVTAIDNKYIIPFTTIITKEYDTVTGTIGVIQTLAHEGLQGILAIPQALSSAFSSLTSGAIKAAELTSTSQTSIAKDILTPAIAVGVGEPIANFGKTFDAFAKPALQGVGYQRPVNIESGSTVDTVGTLLATQALALKNEGGLINDFWAGVYDVIGWFLKTAGGFEAALRVAAFEGNKTARPEPMEQGEALEAWRRGIIDAASLGDELAFRGFSDARIAALKELVQWIPSIREALDMFYRNIISADNLNHILSQHGLNQTDVRSMMDVILEPVNPREAIAANGRKAMADEGWLPNSLGTTVPEEYKALYPPRLANPNIGILDWLEHWKIPDIEWWFVAYFRKLVTKDDVINAAKAENWPVEVINNMFSVRQELIQEWMIPDILASGVMTDQESLDYMSYAGIEPHSAAILLKWGKTKANATTGAKALTLADKFESASKAMFQDGLINKDEYNLLLLDMGFNTEQASLLTGLAQHEIDIASRKTFANLLIRKVLVGEITLQDMQSQLLSQGFTNTETGNYVTQVNTALSDNAKFPTTAEALDMLKKGILTIPQAFTALQTMGWNNFWSQNWLLYAGVTVHDLATALGTSG